MNDQKIQAQFIGTWRLVSQHSIYPNGRIVPSRGENPIGILIYDAHGNMAVQLVRTDDHATDYTNLATLKTAMEGSLAYFGTYEIDEAQQIVKHHVLGSGYFDYRGTTQIRAYEFSDDTLTLRAAAPMDDTTRVLVWKRAGN